MTVFLPGMGWSAVRQTAGHFRRTAAIVCWHLWNIWMRKESWSVKQIFSASVPSAGQNQWPVWIPPVKPLPYPSGNVQKWICRLWQNYREKQRNKSRKNWQAQFSGIHWQTSGKPRMNICPEMYVKSWGLQRDLPKTIRSMKAMCSILKKYSRKTWMLRRLKSAWGQPGLIQSI